MTVGPPAPVAATAPTPGEGRPRYYGWVVAWTAFAVLSLTYGVQFSFGVLLPSIAEDLDISRTAASLCFSVYVFVYSALSSWSGAVTDRRGPRIVLVAGAVLLGAGYALSAMAQNLWQLLVALGLIAGAGMSASFVPCNATVVRWFVRRRGQALSISTSGGSFAAVAMPLLMGALIGRTSWRVLYGVMAAVVFVGLLVASRLLIASPEAKGVPIEGELIRRRRPAPPPVPEGTPGTAGTAGTAASGGAVTVTVTDVGAEEPSLTRAEAMRTRPFWILAGIFLCTWLVVFLPLVHLPPFARSLGASAGVAATLVSAIGIGGLLGRTMTGGVSDRIGAELTLGIVLGVQVVAFLVFAAGGTLAVVYPAAVAYGFGYGGTTTVFPAIVGNRFGRAHAGAIVGLLFAGAGSAAAVGPFAAAWIYDSTGSYRIAFLLSAAVNLIGVSLVVALRAGDRRALPGARAAAA
jgi:MFS family permease